MPCDKRFAHSGDLTRHTLTRIGRGYRARTGEMPYKCDVRCERFSRSSVLTRHELGIDLLPHGTTTRHVHII